MCKGKNKRVVMLYRDGVSEPNERPCAENHFNVVDSRVHAMSALVVGRYACLPFYHELERDLHLLGSKPINSLKQHRYIADFEYYHDIQEYTPRSWFSLQDIPQGAGPFVVKGLTNSKKFDWSRSMFAEDRRSAVKLALDLQNDGLIGQQGVVVREYIELERFETGINGMPITNEWRLFFLGSQLVDYGYYWSIIDDLDRVESARGEFEASGLPFAKKVAEIIAKKTNFFAVDIAKTKAGDWVVIEVNDGQQSGLSMIEANGFYRKLESVLKEVHF